MRRSISRALFVLILGASGLAVLLLVASSVRIAYAQVRPGRGGGGGGGGVQLQTTFPGTAQTGNVNINGTYGINAASGSGGGLSLLGASNSLRLANNNTSLTGANPALQFSSLATPAAFQRLISWDSPLGTAGYFGLASATTTGRLSFGGTTGAEFVPLAGGTSFTIHGSNTGANPNLIVDTQGSAITGPLLDIRMAGVSKLRVMPDGSFGMTYSTGVQSVGAVVGSQCATVAAVSPAPSGLSVGQGCIASQGSALPNWSGQGIQLTLTCEIISATAINIRICNTGTNTYTPPANTTYFARIVP